MCLCTQLVGKKQFKSLSLPPYNVSDRLCLMNSFVAWLSLLFHYYISFLVDLLAFKEELQSSIQVFHLKNVSQNPAISWNVHVWIIKERCMCWNIGNYVACNSAHKVTTFTNLAIDCLIWTQLWSTLMTHWRFFFLLDFGNKVTHLQGKQLQIYQE